MTAQALAFARGFGAAHSSEMFQDLINELSDKPREKQAEQNAVIIAKNLGCSVEEVQEKLDAGKRFPAFLAQA